MLKNIQFLGGFIIFIWSNVLFAESCTYNEAKLALERGNQIRGMSLMEMAAKDGDKRAIQYNSSLNLHQNYTTEHIVMLSTESKIR